jgi:hypothetical protein
MSYQAQVFRILIASPSDVEAERDAAVEAIQEWNDRNSAERRVVLLPLRWETHTAPGYGERPQAIVNRQVVDYCDLVVGIFWTKIGTSTGNAQSGTVEEIERVAAAGKPVLLYYSAAKPDLEDIDPQQLSDLRAFKKQVRPNALSYTYKSSQDFRQQLVRHLEVHVKELMASDPVGPELRPAANILLHLGTDDVSKSFADAVTLKSTWYSIPTLEQIPDFGEVKVTKHRDKSKTAREIVDWVYIDDRNKDYYRDLAKHIQSKGFRPLQFWLKNIGNVGARDIHVKLAIEAKGSGIYVEELKNLHRKPPSKAPPGLFLYDDDVSSRRGSAPLVLSHSWSTHFDVPALQPQRELIVDSSFGIAAIESCDVQITAQIYADILSEPIVAHLTMHLQVKQVDATVAKIIETEKDNVDALILA